MTRVRITHDENNLPTGDFFTATYEEALLNEDHYDSRWAHNDLISSEARELLTRIKFYIRYPKSPLATCDRCSRTEILYGYSVLTQENPMHADKDYCYQCAVAGACTALQVREREAMERTFNYVAYNTLFPESAMPAVEDVERHTCMCGATAYKWGDEWQVNVPNRAQAVEALDNDGNTHLSHKGCVMFCEGCDVYYISGRTTHRGVEFPLFAGRYSHCKDCVTDLTQDDDFYECDGCSSIELESLTTYSHARDRRLCRSCYSDPVWCADCDRGYQEDDGHDDCAEIVGSPDIRSYSYKPYPKFFGVGTYFMGFELEVESSSPRDYSDCDCDEDYGHECCDDSDHDHVTEITHDKLQARVYFKEDGSLDNGFEIVSHPHSLHEYQMNFDWSFLDTLKRNNYVSWNNSNCGLHVHISKTAFELGYNGTRDAHLIRFNKFIYDNQAFVEKIAGRSANQYATFGDKRRVINKVKTGHQTEGRYEVVNTGNSETVEVRIFRGSLRKERVLSGIEFTVAVTEYTRHLRVSFKHNPFSWTKFVQYVSENSDTYPNLFTIINEVFSSALVGQER